MPKFTIQISPYDVCYSLILESQQALFNKEIQGKFLFKGKTLCGYRMLAEYNIQENDQLTFVGTITEKQSQIVDEPTESIKEAKDTTNEFNQKLYQLLHERFNNDQVYAKVLLVLNEFQ